MDISGYSEKGFKRKLAVQALFGKIYYLSEVNFYFDSSSITFAYENMLEMIVAFDLFDLRYINPYSSFIMVLKPL